MARKKKSTKDLNEHKTTTTTTTVKANTTLQYDELVPEMIQPKKEVNFEGFMLAETPQQSSAQQYQSDGELMELKQQLNLEKNKSNLFLIKSYSFIDKTNAEKSTNLNVKQKLEEFDKFHTQLLDKSLRDNKQEQKAKSVKSKSSKSKQKIIDKNEKLDKPKKPPKLRTFKKSKSIYDSTENLQELLRNPSVILEDEEKMANIKRPHSLTVTQSRHRSFTKSKTQDDIDTPRLKRDSFLRHSLQSIRRSFSSSKKHHNHISFTSSSSTSSSSNSSAASDTLKKSKAKDDSKDIGNLKDVEETNYMLAEQEEETLSRPCTIVITLSDAQTLEQQQQQHQPPTHIQQQHSIEAASVDVLSCTNFTPSPSLYTMDSLAVLKEEDEKDLASCINNNPPCAITEKSSLAQLPTDSLSPMAPLQTHTECISVQCLNTLDKDYTSSSSSVAATSNNNNNTTTTSSSSPPQKSKRVFQHQLSIPESLQSTSIGCATSSEYSSARSLKQSATSLTPLPTVNSTGNLRSISPLRRSASSNSSSTAKHEQSTAAATAAAAATATTSNGSSSTTTPPEKEKKRKEISSSRVKKFHRHFAQVSKDEKLINYFSCALVSDILLQGHLYITDQHFAFYSNVFGYVTKVVIPTSSVTKISKEKTAKIIPNAVGVATADERHVFGSFISREAAFRLMCSVCPPLGVPEILPKDPANIEISEEYSIEDDSSCSISGNESPAQITELKNSNTNGNLLHNDTSQTLLRRSVGSSNLSIAETRHSDIPIHAKTVTTTASSRASAPAATTTHHTNGSNVGISGGGGGNINLVGLKSVLQPAIKPTSEGQGSKLTIIAGCASSSTTSATSTPTPSTTSSPTTVMTLPSSKANRVMNIFRTISKKLMIHLKFPTEIHVVYLGVILTLLLALFSIFLLYRILDIEAKTNGYRSPVEFNWRTGNDDDIFSEALRFQKQLQLKSTEEAQNILKTNLEQIAKVRRSLETLSMLIHDRSSSFVSTNTDDSD